MPPPSLAELDPKQERKLDAPKSEPFQMLKHARQPQMMVS